MGISQSPILQSDGSSVSKEENALDRMAQLPVVASTWSTMHSYYSDVKKNYPNICPYLETAEKLTCSAANMALMTSRPVVDKLAPTVNSFANQGLDKLEYTVPMITREPMEIYQRTKKTTACMFASQVNNVLDTTEKCVDYFLPDGNDQESSDKQENDVIDDSSSDREIEENQASFSDEKHPGERIREISNKVQKRSFRRAMTKWHGVHARSREALSKLKFTVDLIQYAQGTIETSQLAASANEKVVDGVLATLDGFQYAANVINQQVEKQVLARASNLTGQLHESCTRAVNHLQNYPRMHHLLEQAIKTKEVAADLVVAFTDKTSISQLSNAIVTSTRPKVKFVEETLLGILGALVDQPPIDWLAPDVEGDPLDGLDMREIEAQLYDAPPHQQNVRGRCLYWSEFRLVY